MRAVLECAASYHRSPAPRARIRSGEDRRIKPRKGTLPRSRTITLTDTVDPSQGRTPGGSVHGPIATLARVVSIVAILYVFLVSISLLGGGFKMLGAGFSENLIRTTSNPLMGLFIGILATSLVQSSSMTTSTVVGFVASGMLSIEHAVPIVMGANIGTTVTNTIVSLGHITRNEEFRRAFAAATVHDFFNVIAVLILFPIELATGFLRRTAAALAGFLTGGESVHFASPVKAVVKPTVKLLEHAVEGVAGEHAGVFVTILAALILFFSLYLIVRITKTLAMGRAEVVIDRLMGRSGPAGIAVGAGLTAVVQSSSITTSLLVPLAGAGIARIEKVFAVTLGANIGTTVTALLASLAGDARGLTIALVHLLFNVTGILIIYPNRRVRGVPIALAKRLADAAVRSKRNVAFFVLGLFYALPGVLILIDRLT
jgi:sodium-dependent phosphate cotransporter